MNIKRNFYKGVMNKDVDERLLPEGVYVHAENIQSTKSQSSDSGSVENIISNVKKSDINYIQNKPKTIGSVPDIFNKRIYWMVVDGEWSYLNEFDINTGQSTVLLSDNQSILDFNENFTITGSDVLIDSDNGKTFLLLTDDRSEIKMIDIEWARNTQSNSYTLDDILLYKKPPLEKPKITLVDTGLDENYIKDKFLQFSYRYIYKNGEVSAMSPFTSPAFQPSNFDYDYATLENKSMYNNYNAVDIEVKSGGDNVKEIEILFKYNNSSTVYIAKTIKEDGSNTYTERFKNSSIYKILQEDQIYRLYDNIPRKAKSLTLLGNRLFLGGYTENYNVDESSIDYNVNIHSETVPVGIGYKTIKSLRDVEVGIAYLDDKLRQSTVFIKDNTSAHIPITASDKKTTISVGITSKAPSWARYYRFYIKQSRENYYTIIPTLFFEEGAFIWFKLESSDKDKIKVGDYLYIKAGSDGLATIEEEIKVLEVEHKKKDWLDNGSSQPSGVYFKVKSTDVRISDDDFQRYSATCWGRSSEDVSFMSRWDYGRYFEYLPNFVNYCENPYFYPSSGSSLLDDLTHNNDYNDSSEDRRFVIIIDSVGATDTFKWSNDGGSSFQATGVQITGGDQTLSHGLSIKFSNTTGHSVNDKWTINAKGANTDNFLGETRHKGYALQPFNDPIEAGARIKININEYGAYDDGTDGNMWFTASRKYATLEEWFWEDNIYDALNQKLTDLDNRLWFRHGHVYNYENTKAMHLTLPSDGGLVMIIRTYGVQHNWTEGRAKIKLKFEIIQSDKKVILETKPVNINDDIFYEIGDTYEIDQNGNHLGKVENQDDSQTSSSAAKINLQVFNAYGFGNGVEEIHINGGFNMDRVGLWTRPSSYIKDYKENNRIASITWSEIYEQTTNSFRLNEFITYNNNFIDVEDKWGKIMKLYNLNGDLLIFQKFRTGKSLHRQNILSDTQGNQLVSKSKDVISYPQYYKYNIGIGDYPESFAVHRGRIYHTDNYNRIVARLSNNGYTVISDYGMRDWFRDSFKTFNNIRGGYDKYMDEYILKYKDK